MIDEPIVLCIRIVTLLIIPPYVINCIVTFALSTDCDQEFEE